MPELITWRRHLHMYPELGFQEHRTAGFVAERLAAVGLTVARPTETGVVALVEGALPGPTIAVRADLDALPIQEENQVDYASCHPGVMHACGHDGHAAILLGLARVLQATRGELAGRVKLIFQPAEEKPPGGALPLIEAGVLDGVAAVLGFHLWADLPVGTAAVGAGTVMASADEFTITVQGRGGHGSQPHQAVDAVVVAAQVVLNLQTIVSRKVDPRRPAVISVGTIQAGYAFNVIAPTATMAGTVRTFDPATRDMVKREIEQVVRHTCAMAGAEGEFRLFGGYPSVVNDPRLAAMVGEAAGEVFGPERISPQEPVMGGEDFAHYAERVPSCYMFIGARNEVKGIVHPHHHPRFDIDEDALPAGVELLVRAVRIVSRGSGW